MCPGHCGVPTVVQGSHPEPGHALDQKAASLPEAGQKDRDLVSGCFAISVRTGPGPQHSNTPMLSAARPRGHVCSPHRNTKKKKKYRGAPQFLSFPKKSQPLLVAPSCTLLPTTPTHGLTAGDRQVQNRQPPQNSHDPLGTAALGDHPCPSVFGLSLLLTSTLGPDVTSTMSPLPAELP